MMPDLKPWDIPEVLALQGIPQPERHHPEIDTYVHTCMAWDAAKRLAPNDHILHFAVMLHDLGKAHTDPSNWPHHYGHEDLGVPDAIAVTRRYFDGIGQAGDLSQAPEYIEAVSLVTMVCRYHVVVHQAMELSDKATRRLFKATNAVQQPELFDRFLIACEADARGRQGMHNREYPQVDLLRGKLRAYAEDLRRECIQTKIRRSLSDVIPPEALDPNERRQLRQLTKDLAELAHNARERARRI